MGVCTGSEWEYVQVVSARLHPLRSHAKIFCRTSGSTAGISTVILHLSLESASLAHLDLPLSEDFAMYDYEVPRDELEHIVNLL